MGGRSLMQSPQGGGARLRLGVLAGILIAALWFAGQLSTAPTSPAGDPYVRTLTRSHEDRREAILVRGDGQFYAALATDPSLSRPELLRAPRAEYAYRWMRPLLAWSAWAASAGRGDAVPSALIALTVLSVGVFVAGLGMLAMVLGRDPLVALSGIALPGALVVLQWTGPEILASGLGAAACALVVRGRRATPAAVGLFVLSVLARETLLLLALGAGIWLWRSAGRRRDAVTVVAAPGLAFALWASTVWIRTGAWFFEKGEDRLSAPLAGVVRAAPGWSPDSVVMLALIGAVIALGVLRAGCHRSTVLLLSGPTLAFATIMGEPVWARWQDAGRVLLPVSAVLLLAACPTLRSPSEAAAP